MLDDDVHSEINTVPGFLQKKLIIKQTGSCVSVVGTLVWV